MVMECYKVVDENLQSLQLAGNKKVIQYIIGEWVSEPEPVEGPGLHGGILSYNYLSDAKWLAKYMQAHPNPDIRKNVRIFKNITRGILYKRLRKSGSLYTIKSRETKLVREIDWRE